MKRLLLAVLAIMLAVGVACSALADTAGLVVNGGFDDIAASYKLPLGWDTDIWDASTGTSITYADAEGRGNVVVISSETANDAKFYQSIAVESGSYYKFTCDIKTDNVTGGAGANISVMDSYAQSTGLMGTNDWTSVTFYGTTGSDQKTLKVCVRLGGYSATSSGTAWFDNVLVEKVDSVPAGFEAQKLYNESSAGSNSSSDEKLSNSSAAAAAKAKEVPFTGYMLAAVLVTLLFGAMLYYNFLREKDNAIKLAEDNRKKDHFTIVFVLLAALLLRVAANFLFTSTGADATYYGHSTDIRCFTAWGERLSTVGPSNFYSPDYFCDYPPGYLYIAGLFASIANIFGFAAHTPAYALILKMPAILADLGLAYMVYRLAKRMGRADRSAQAIMYFVAFNPLTIFISAVWGQIDSILTLLLAGAAMMFVYGTKMINAPGEVRADKAPSFINWRVVCAGALYGLAILIKPQALMFGPILAIAYLCYIIFAKKYNTEVISAIVTTLLSVIAALLVIIVPSYPFFGANIFKLGEGGLLEKYIGTATSYNYASVEAFNFMSLIGGNWKDADAMIGSLGISYATLGTLFMALIIAISAVFYFITAKRGRSTRSLVLILAFMMTGLFTLGHFMHERYLYPALLLILIAAILYNDRRLYGLFIWFSASMLLNSMCAFIIIDWRELQWVDTYTTLVYIGSVMTVVGFLYFLWTTISIVFQEHSAPAFCVTPDNQKKADNAEDEAKKGTSYSILPKPTDNKLHMKKLDWLFLCGVTLIYAIVALTNLGTTQAPQNEWSASASAEGYEIEFDGTVDIAAVYVYPGIAKESTVVFRDSDGNEIPGLTYSQEYGHMYRWHEISKSLDVTTDKLVMVVEKGTAKFLEFAFYDKDGNLLRAHASGNAAALVDEQDQIPETFSYMTGMYFDELYHARTGYEHLNGLSVYETSHPPLGKIFISLGIAVFGMNPFGWRIMGTLFGIAMVPLLYVFAKRLFKKPVWALITTVLFAFDFMHYTQTRIATIDSYGVFFILLMFYYMYQYFTMNFYVDGLKKTLKPLALAGLFFGMGAASKWICIYAGGGLAVMLFVSLFKRYSEYCKIRANGTEEERALVSSFWKNLVLTLLWCCLFFVLIPVVIYLASYLVFPDIMGYLKEGNIAGAWDRFWNHYQKYCMFNYHSNLLESTPHPYRASWYEWPLILRPMWFYKGNVPSGYAASITCFGNPMVWLPGLVGFVCFIGALLKRKVKWTPAATMLLIAIAANFLPWVIVTRSTYIYHYFASVPFVLLTAVYFLKELEEKHKWLSYLKWYWMGAALLLFGMFYPVLTGTTVSKTYMELLQWLPRWTFMGSQGPDSGRWFGLAVMLAIIIGAVIVGAFAYKRFGGENAPEPDEEEQEVLLDE